MNILINYDFDFFLKVPIKKFNELRYNTALLLKEMEEVDGKQALKLLET